MVHKFILVFVVACLVLGLTGVALAAQLDVGYSDGTTTSTVGYQSGEGAYHFDVYHHGTEATSAVATVGEKTYAWGGQGSENADLSDYDEGYWHWILTPPDKPGKGKTVLTISGSEGSNKVPENGNGNGTPPENGNGVPPVDPEDPDKPDTPNGGWDIPHIDYPVDMEPHNRVLAIAEARKALPQTDGGNLRIALGFIGMFLLGCLVIYGLVMWENK